METGMSSAMKQGERVDHVGEAEALLMAADYTVSENHRVNTGEYKADILANAQVHATLALVEQQRIANLIALGQANHADGSRVMWRALVDPVGVDGVMVRADVREGLGL